MMRLQRIICGFSRKRSGIVVLMGVSAVLAGAQRLLSPTPRESRAVPAEEPVREAPQPQKQQIEVRRSCFKIRQTRSDIGLVLWVLQGFGCYESFSLHDSWREAMDEANRRIAERQPAVSQEVAVLNYAVAVPAH